MLTIILLILLIMSIVLNYKIWEMKNNLKERCEFLEDENQDLLDCYDRIRDVNTRLRLENNQSKALADDIIIQETARKERIANPYIMDIEKIRSMQNNIGGM